MTCKLGTYGIITEAILYDDVTKWDKFYVTCCKLLVCLKLSILTSNIYGVLIWNLKKHSFDVKIFCCHDRDQTKSTYVHKQDSTQRYALFFGL